MSSTAAAMLEKAEETSGFVNTARKVLRQTCCWCCVGGKKQRRERFRELKMMFRTQHSVFSIIAPMPVNNILIFLTCLYSIHYINHTPPSLSVGNRVLHPVPASGGVLLHHPAQRHHQRPLPDPHHATHNALRNADRRGNPWRDPDDHIFYPVIFRRKHR